LELELWTLTTGGKYRATTTTGLNQ